VPLIQLFLTALSMVEVKIFLGEEVLEILVERQGGLSPFP
jgi:hypothetical protein